MGVSTIQPDVSLQPPENITRSLIQIASVVSDLFKHYERSTAIPKVVYPRTSTEKSSQLSNTISMLEGYALSECDESSDPDVTQLNHNDLDGTLRTIQELRSNCPPNPVTSDTIYHQLSIIQTLLESIGTIQERNVRPACTPFRGSGRVDRVDRPNPLKRNLPRRQLSFNNISACEHSGNVQNQSKTNLAKRRLNFSGNSFNDEAANIQITVQGQPIDLSQRNLPRRRLSFNDSSVHDAAPPARKLDYNYNYNTTPTRHSLVNSFPKRRLNFNDKSLDDHNSRLPNIPDEEESAENPPVINLNINPNYVPEPHNDSEESLNLINSSAELEGYTGDNNVSAETIQRIMHELSLNRKRYSNLKDQIKNILTATNQILNSTMKSASNNDKPL